MPSLVEIGPVVLEKKIFNFANVFLLFHNYLPLEEGGALHLNKLESLLALLYSSFREKNEIHDMLTTAPQCQLRIYMSFT